ncbi:hypothetical protein HT576_00075 [Haloterrigena sp. SYSU A121-1]|uniref:Twin-arginine translocation signal domain-containing protein n=1 Tax=Haloterrigena gelatinilytica TaxID=2741724 RepID=A0A8J8KCT1_9EURY|nr:hypothetical protein [Haloterrigena gelatinilytica]NUB89428.1 hypothetical protein [Haloterrigena gelatinilytica]
MTRDAYSRRDWLRKASVAGVAVGGGAIGLSGTGSARPALVDSDDVGLTADCADDDRAVFCATNDGRRPAFLEWQRRPLEPGIEFIDCQTIRVVGTFAEVVTEVTFLTEAGSVGNDFLYFGSVDGVRVIDITEHERGPADGIIGTAEAFEEGPTVPGGGDVVASNPEYDDCQEEYFGEIVVEGTESATNDESATAAAATGDRNRLIVPPSSTRCFSVAVDDGPVAVDLFYDGERVDTAVSATDEPCPNRPGRGRRIRRIRRWFR